eukprot:gb/GEZN01007401.1/.p1 GENE.gb/GEZN01007401.1/~~gb/GEZN01007401.1/.p1  ORF type:complete len:320 (-),score=8.47 gb/GEZN01007401.1/:391-1350(-)
MSKGHGNSKKRKRRSTRMLPSVAAGLHTTYSPRLRDAAVLQQAKTAALQAGSDDRHYPTELHQVRHAREKGDDHGARDDLSWAYNKLYSDNPHEVSIIQHSHGDTKVVWIHRKLWNFVVSLLTNDGVLYLSVSPLGIDAGYDGNPWVVTKLCARVVTMRGDPVVVPVIMASYRPPLPSTIRFLFRYLKTVTPELGTSLRYAVMDMDPGQLLVTSLEFSKTFVALDQRHLFAAIDRIKNASSSDKDALKRDIVGNGPGSLNPGLLGIDDKDELKRSIAAKFTGWSDPIRRYMNERKQHAITVSHSAAACDAQSGSSSMVK